MGSEGSRSADAGIVHETMYFLPEGGQIRHFDHEVELYTHIESFLAEHLK